MSAITVSGDLLHYEVLGRGRPIILLHSWLGSWRYWIPTMQQLSVKYRIYAIDLWGFGDSGKNKPFYDIEGQAQLLELFLERMGITKAVFIGHGLGAAVLSHFATRPNCSSTVHRMMLVSPPLFGVGFRSASTPADTSAKKEDKADAAKATPKVEEKSPPMTVSVSEDAETIMSVPKDFRSKLLEENAKLQQQKKEPKAEEKTKDEPGAAKKTGEKPDPNKETRKQSQEMAQPTFSGTNPLAEMIQRNKPQALLSRHMDTSSSDYEKLRGEVEKADEKALEISAQSLSKHNPYTKLLQTPAPTLTLLGDSDTFVTKPDDAVLEKLSTHELIKLLILSNTRHFPMLEDTSRFTRLLKEFLEAPDIQQLEMKDEWKRRLR